MKLSASVGLCIEVREVPRRGLSHAKVRIVRQERVAADRARPVHDPVVGANVLAENARTDQHVPKCVRALQPVRGPADCRVDIQRPIGTAHGESLHRSIVARGGRGLPVGRKDRAFEERAAGPQVGELGVIVDRSARLTGVDDVRLLVGEAVDQRDDRRGAVLRCPRRNVLGIVVQEYTRELVRENRSWVAGLDFFEPLVDACTVRFKERGGFGGGVLEQLFLERSAFAV